MPITNEMLEFDYKFQRDEAHFYWISIKISFSSSANSSKDMKSH